MKTRDRVIAVLAMMAVFGLGGLVAKTVIDAQDRGRSALERNQAATVRQIAAGMESRFRSTLESFLGLANRPLSFQVGDPADLASIQEIQDLVPELETGILLLTPDGVVTAGTLLQNPTVVGEVLDRPGLAEMVASGKPAILPAAEGLTTDLPTLAVASPIPDVETGQIKGVFLFESAVSADSDFNKEVAELRQGKTGVFTFVDQLGTVIVATDPDLLGKPLADPDLAVGEPGLRREGGNIVGIADVPAAGWRLIFTQDEDEFEAGLGDRVQSAVLMLILGALLAAGLAFLAVLRRLRAERAERERIEEINATREEFVSIVSHELRTPVAGVLGFLQSALDHWDGLDDGARRHAIQRACSNAQRLQAMTRDVLDSTRAESGEFEYAFDLVDLSASIESAVGVARDLEPDRTFDLELPAARAWVQADPDRVQQVMTNLLDNAVKNSSRDRPVAIDVAVVDNEAVVTVTDRGPGLTEAEMAHVFDKWVRGRSTVYGTGLGLYVAREIVHAHRGRMWAEQSPGGGARFGFAIPLAPTPAESTSV